MEITTQSVRIDGKYILGVCMRLVEKKLVVLRGEKGYVMCGYLNMDTANLFEEVAVKVTGVNSIEDALNTTVNDCSNAAQARGIHKGQRVQEILPLIA